MRKESVEEACSALDAAQDQVLLADKHLCIERVGRAQARRMASTPHLSLSSSIANRAQAPRITNRVLPWRTALSRRDFGEKRTLHNESQAGFS